MPTTLSTGVALTQVMILLLPFLRFFYFLTFFSINFIYIYQYHGVGFYLSFPTLLLQLAGGNSALALAMTIISNMLGILIVSHEEFHA